VSDNKGRVKFRHKPCADDRSVLASLPIACYVCMHGLEPDCMGSQMRRVAEKKERKGKEGLSSLDVSSSSPSKGANTRSTSMYFSVMYVNYQVGSSDP
jgi:hypothetical protein